MVATKMAMQTGNKSCLNGSWWKESLDINLTLVCDTSSSFDLEGYPFPSKYTWLHITLSALVVGIIILFIISGNALVVIAIAVDRNLNTVQNYFIASLAVSDLSLGLCVMPLSLTKELIGYWYFGETLCDIWLAVDVFLCTASILNLCLISLDRYWSVTRAVSYAKQRTSRRALFMILVAWALALIICLPPLAGWKRSQTSPSKDYPDCQLSSDIGYVAYSALGSFYIPLVLMIIVYVKIYMTALARARRNLKRNIPASTNGKAIDKSTSNSLSSPQAKTSGTIASTTAHNVARCELSSYEEEDYGDCAATETGMRSFRLAPVSEIPNSDSATDFGSDGAIKMQVTNLNYHQQQSTDENNRLLVDETDSACDTAIAKLYITNPNYSSRQTSIAITTTTTTDDEDRNYLTINSTLSAEFSISKVSELLPSSRQILSEDEVGRSGVEDNLQPLLNSNPQHHHHHQHTSKTLKFPSFISRTKKPPQDFDATPTKRLPSKASAESGRSRTSLRGPVRKPSVLNSPRFQKFGSKIFRGSEREEGRPDDPERQRRKIAKQRERRATVVLGIVMATFISSWLPFFIVYPLSLAIGFIVPRSLFAVIFWAGYCNSAMNPIIYTIFNREFRQAFYKILCKRRRRS